jgi:hypothetical protein
MASTVFMDGRDNGPAMTNLLGSKGLRKQVWRATSSSWRLGGSGLRRAAGFASARGNMFFARARFFAVLLGSVDAGAWEVVR